MRALLPIAALILAGCGSSPEPAAKTEAPPATAPAPVKDLTSLLPAAGRVGAKVVPDHLLDQPKMPGGTLGDYTVGNKKYQLFIIESDNAQDAALIMLDMKSALQNPEYLPNFGGYFGTLGTQPAFVFAKLQYLAGVVGLSQKDAEPIARTLAARLR
ncbi:MAG: hypothetical protein ABSB15_15680 [Bryobacteraceae bacterium]|jgi:hypothetical protein